MRIAHQRLQLLVLVLIVAAMLAVSSMRLCSLRAAVPARNQTRILLSAQSSKYHAKSSSQSESAGVRPLSVILVGLVGLGILKAYNVRQQRIKEANESDFVVDPDLVVEGSWPLRMYAALPLREVSRAWGYINSLTVPISLRTPLYKAYSNAFSCNLDEMEAESLDEFENLGTFFYRSLKSGSRVVDLQAELVSPSDGKILCCGKFDRQSPRIVPLVKGLTYSLDALLGKRSQKAIVDAEAIKVNSDATEPLRNGNSLHYCVIYLAPGDYHRFHSPTDWIITSRRHFAGEMLSVSPWIVSKIRNLFTLNERISLTGTWKYGFFSMIPVAATNVGKIILNFEPELETNTKDIPNMGRPLGTFTERVYTGKDAVHALKGEEIGGFQLGSTIVLVFEAPEGFEFSMGEGDVVQMGQRLTK